MLSKVDQIYNIGQNAVNKRQLKNKNEQYFAVRLLIFKVAETFCWFFIRDCLYLKSSIHQIVMLQSLSLQINEYEYLLWLETENFQPTEMIGLGSYPTCLLVSFFIRNHQRPQFKIKLFCVIIPGNEHVPFGYLSNFWHKRLFC